MTATRGFNTQRRLGQHRLGDQPRAERGRLDIFPFWPAYDKACSSPRVATVSFRAASATGVSVDQSHQQNVNEGGCYGC